MADSVVVPVYAAELNGSKVVVEVAQDHFALCTRVQSVPHDFFGRAVSRCGEDAWVRVRLGVRAYLDIDRRVGDQTIATPAAPRSDWWPRQHAVHFARNASIGPEDKLYAVVSDNDWNSAPTTQYVGAVRLTSHTKVARARWEVAVAGSWTVVGDLYSISHQRFEQGAPRGDYPTQISPKESADIARKQKITLSLR